jgi:hypothetical protein
MPMTPLKDATVDEIRQRVQEVLALRHDSEAAHGADDDLRRAFLVWLAYGALRGGAKPVQAPIRDIVEMARLLLTTEDAFERWCA